MSFLVPKPPKPVAGVDPADVANRLNSARSRRLQSGGSNATFLSATTDAARGVATGTTKPTATLTGLSG